jgi:serine/threonine protein kinase
MELHCTRPGCAKPTNFFTDLDTPTTLKTVQQKFCTNCGMPLILLGRYLTTKLLGQGGFGAAFLARDRYTPGLRQCVVKQFQPSGNLTPQQIQLAQSLFEREAEVLEKLGNEHPQIPDLFAFFELEVPGLQASRPDRFFYLVQEFIDGQDLEEELHQKGQFSEAEVLEVLQETLKILQFVHENGSIHRDIKPSNIMRHRNGRIYLLDFGAVKQATTAGGAGQGSTGIYSLGFAPPEQMAGDEVYPSTDLYALAVTCITLLTGKQPKELFDAYSNTWKWQTYAQPSRRLTDVLDKMLMSTPDRRWQSATDALAALTAPPPPPAAPPSAQSSAQSRAQSSTQSSAQSMGTPLATGGASTPLPALTNPPAPHPNTVAPGVPLAPALAPKPARTRFQSSATPFSLVEVLGGAAFTGFEGALLAIALFSLPIPAPFNAVLWLLLAIGLVFAQARRIIEKVDLVILSGITLALVAFLPLFHRVIIPVAAGNPLMLILVVAGLGGVVAVAVATLFRLIYKLLSTFL